MRREQVAQLRNLSKRSLLLCLVPPGQTLSDEGLSYSSIGEFGTVQISIGHLAYANAGAS